MAVRLRRRAENGFHDRKLGVIEYALSIIRQS